MDELKCPKCGQELRTISVGVFCDNCGPLEFGMDVMAKIEKAEAKVRADIAKACNVLYEKCPTIDHVGKEKCMNSEVLDFNRPIDWIDGHKQIREIDMLCKDCYCDFKNGIALCVKAVSEGKA